MQGFSFLHTQLNRTAEVTAQVLPIFKGKQKKREMHYSTLLTHYIYSSRDTQAKHNTCFYDFALTTQLNPL